MKHETIMPPNFMGRVAKILEEVSARACVDEIDIEILKDILKDAIIDYYHDDYHDGYYEGHHDGFELGYSEGYDDSFCGIVAYKRPRQP